MKRSLFFCLAILLCLVLCGCEAGNNTSSSSLPSLESNDASDAVSNETSDDVSIEVSDAVSNETSDDVSIEVSDAVSNDVSDTISNDESDTVSAGESKPEKDEVLYESGFLKGTLVDKIAPNILVIDQFFFLPFDVCEDGIVHAVTDDIDEWCLEDDLTVWFSEITIPGDSAQPVSVIATEIYIDEDVVIMPEKPIIYLYPEEPTVCSVELLLNGLLTCTYPSYESGWDSFTAYPDGTLVFPDGKEYYALYWEGIQNTVYDFTKGFCVRGEDTAEFLEWALAKQGLTPRETNEFIIYWLPQMQNNPYNVISFQTSAYTDGAELIIDPLPDSMLRVFMAYYPTDTEIEMEPQSFTPFERRGFTVVEWGGAKLG